MSGRLDGLAAESFDIAARLDQNVETGRRLTLDDDRPGWYFLNMTVDA